MNGQVYILKVEGQNAYKIGITSGKISERISALQTGNPYKIRHIFSAQVENSANLEKFLHGHFQAKKMQGEWYQLDANQLAEAIRMIQYFQSEYALKLAIDTRTNVQDKSKTTPKQTEKIDETEKVIRLLERSQYIGLYDLVQFHLNIKNEDEIYKKMDWIISLLRQLGRFDLWDKYGIDDII